MIPQPSNSAHLTSHVTHSYMWYDSFIRVTWLIRICDMAHSYMRHESFIYEWFHSLVTVHIWNHMHICVSLHMWVNSTYLCVVYMHVCMHSTCTFHICEYFACIIVCMLHVYCFVFLCTCIFVCIPQSSISDRKKRICLHIHVMSGDITCIFMHICVSMSVCVCVCVCLHFKKYACIYMWCQVISHVCLCISVCLCVCVCVCVCVLA